jgi:hypothetical protein
MPNNTEIYEIPKKYRMIENLHIVFWLIKDLCWCIVFKPLGIAMIIPTLGISIYIAWQNRKIASELYHNVAVTFWIMANSYWMISEFMGFDEKKFIYNIEGKQFAVLPFVLGIICLLIYYVPLLLKSKRQ